MEGVRQWLRTALGFGGSDINIELGQALSSGPRLDIVAGVQVPAIGEILGGRYRLDQLIGRGGVAVVYRAYDLKLQHLFTVKVLMLDGVADEDVDSDLKRSLRIEALAAMRLSHPFIARVYHYEHQGPWEFLIMEFVSGTDLRIVTRTRQNGRLEVEETVHIGLDVLEALAYAHQQGVIHNDISPRNILIDSQYNIKLCDFGLSRLIDLQIIHSPRTISGTVAYMSPERIRGLAADARSDLYSLAATMYALSTGRTPFGTRPTEAVKGHTKLDFSSFPHLPPAFEMVLRKAMEKDPKDRFSDAKEMADALRDILCGRQLVLTEDPIEIAPKVKQAEGAPTLPTPPKGLEDEQKRDDLVSTDMILIKPRTIEYEEKVFDIQGFYMDRTPVTNAKYAKFVREEGQIPPSWWLGRRPPKDRLDHPVVGITIADARRFAAWCGKRLPTTLEWLAVVQGEQGWRFPWGNDPQQGSCHCPRNQPGQTTAVGTHPLGASAEGCLDLLGNVWEWTEVDLRYPPPETGYFYVMGGSYRHPCRAEEGIVPRSTVSESGEYLYLGFRCSGDKD
ncbi:MAG: protein kinase [Gammaproteobacteria bacterium]|nr:protein kinase [Gammaproteobacteria bacterium]